MNPDTASIITIPAASSRQSAAQHAVGGSVVLLSTPEELTPYRGACEELARQALEPNIIFEHWMLQPAWEAFGNNRVEVALVFSSGNGTRSELIGLFPLTRSKGYRRVPIEIFAVWRHLHSPLCTPLLHRDYAREALHGFFTWLDRRPGGAAIQFEHVGGDGPFWELFTTYLSSTGRPRLEHDIFERAFFRPGADASTYIENALVNKRRKELRRLWNRLSELGNLQLVELRCDESVEPWLNEFTALEELGWKGRTGSAISLHEQEKRYFERITIEAHRRGRLMMLKLQLDDRPVAMKYNLLCEDGSYAAKIAFNEEFRQYSPGVQLELQNIQVLHGRPEIRWMDSCAMPNHFMIERLWTERRVLRSCLVSTGRLTGNMVIRLFPIAEKLYRRYMRKETV